MENVSLDCGHARGSAGWRGFGGHFYAAAPHPSRLRRATFPRGGRFWCGGTWRVQRKTHAGGGGVPPPYAWAYVPFPKLPSRIESGDPLRCGPTTRALVSNCQRRHAALPLPLGEVARRSRDGEGFPSPSPCNEPGDTQWCGSTARVSGPNCQRPLAARPD